MTELRNELDTLREAHLGDDTDAGLLAQKGFSVNLKILELDDKIDELKAALVEEKQAKKDAERKSALDLQVQPDTSLS